MLSPNKLGFQCKLYYNTAGIGGPTIPGIEAQSVSMATLEVPIAEGDVSVRGGGGFKFSVGQLIDAGITVKVPYVPTDPFVAAVVAANFARTVLGIAALDGDKAVTGSQGLVAEMQVFNLKRVEDVDKPVELEFTFKPTYPSSNLHE